LLDIQVLTENQSWMVEAFLLETLSLLYRQKRDGGITCPCYQHESALRAELAYVPTWGSSAFHISQDGISMMYRKNEKQRTASGASPYQENAIKDISAKFKHYKNILKTLLISLKMLMK